MLNVEFLRRQPSSCPLLPKRKKTDARSDRSVFRGGRQCRVPRIADPHGPLTRTLLRRTGLVLEGRFVRHRQFLAALRTARSQYLATVCRSHASAETVLVDALATRGLVSSLHCHSCIVFIVFYFFTECKSTTKKLFAKIFHEFISKRRQIARNLLSLSWDERAPTARPRARSATSTYTH